MIFGDASFFIGLANRNDRWHRDALRLSRGVRDRLLVSDLVVAEAVTPIGSRVGAKAGLALFRYFFDECEVVFVDKDVLTAAMPQWLKFDGRLSVSDAVALEIMGREGASKILSFDSDFDGIPGIIRLH